MKDEAFFPVRDVLNDLFYRLGMNAKMKQMNVLKSWPQVVGEAISKHSQPTAIRKKNLFVKVDSSVWIAQLLHFKEKIILEFNKRQGQEVIENIYFRLGSISSFPPEKEKIENKLITVKLDEKDKQWIDKIVMKTKDQDLKNLVRRILSKHKKFEKLKK